MNLREKKIQNTPSSPNKQMMTSMRYGTTSNSPKIQVIEVPKVGGGGREIEKIFGEIIIKHFQNLMELQTHRTKKISETQAYKT